MRCPAETLPKEVIISVTFRSVFVGIVPMAKVRNQLCKNCVTSSSFHGCLMQSSTKLFITRFPGIQQCSGLKQRKHSLVEFCLSTFHKGSWEATHGLPCESLFICGVAEWLLGTSCLLSPPSVHLISISGPSATLGEDGFTEVCEDLVLGPEALEAQEPALYQVALPCPALRVPR